MKLNVSTLHYEDVKRFVEKRNDVYFDGFEVNGNVYAVLKNKRGENMTETKQTNLENREESENAKPNRPDYRVVQADTDQNGKPRFTEVGAIWINTSKKESNLAGVLKLGNLRLLLFK